ncbi:MAG: sigma-70 family RNA polymerase sigma factor, partial [Ignavibacteria bacterium]|nr:sigma-70 family RNA polymerase sigma factor [Ignavibacteria bacterium]
MSENKQTTDSELLLQIVGYNAEAFEQLYNRYSATIYSFIKEIVSSPKLAEKIMLNVFSVFLKRIEYYSTTDNNVFTYLSLLTRNIALDVFKRMKFVEDIPIYSDEYEIEFILPNLSSKISPINLDEKIILGEKIKEYKSHLTEVQNLVLSLVYFEGLNEGEIAKRLNVPIVTVRQKIITIMANLHQQYTGRAAENNNNNKE